ncbi:MAG: sodium:solute symporter family protein [Candidatus Parabeggiatoa sp.]|nr:sodium:solute symporter family protein [Candidatus Parabeggiatoa sp.]
MSMDTWLILVVGAYWAYCIYWGWRGACLAKTAKDYFIAGGSISFFIFVLAATATSFSGWTFMSHPGMIFEHGFPAAYISFYAITIPFTGVLFLKRQWLLGKYHGFVTPGEMFSKYFQTQAMRWLVFIVALLFSVIYISIQLRASGFLFNILTGLDTNIGMLLLSIVLTVYVALGGLRAVAHVDAMQVILFALGIVAIGMIVLFSVEGGLKEGIVALTEFDYNRVTEHNYSHYIAISDSFFSAEDGQWTPIFIFTFMLALMGIQCSPAFSMWAFSNDSPRPFASQQVIASSLIIGFILFFFTAIQGIGAHLLGANAVFHKNHPEVMHSVNGAFMDGVTVSDTLIPKIIHLLDNIPMLAALLAVCALAAMQSTASSYISTTSGIFTRDIFKRGASDKQQILWGRISAAGIVILALLVAFLFEQNIALLGGLAVAYGLQMLPALVAICWWPWLTRLGIITGLIVGILAVTATDLAGQWLPWGKYPFTIHSAGWGILFNFGLAILVSAMTQNKAELKHRMTFHNVLKRQVAFPKAKKNWIPVVIGFTLFWFFVAIGPGAIWGNWIFGDPNNPNDWLFGIPSIWTWQIVWWIVGVFMMWILAVKMEMSTMSDEKIDDITSLSLSQNYASCNIATGYLKS